MFNSELTEDHNDNSVTGLGGVAGFSSGLGMFLVILRSVGAFLGLSRPVGACLVISCTSPSLMMLKYVLSILFRKMIFLILSLQIS